MSFLRSLFSTRWCRDAECRGGQDIVDLVRLMGAVSPR